MQTEPQTESKKKLHTVKLVVVIVALVVIAVVVLENIEAVPVQILFLKKNIPLAVVVAVSAGVGFLSGILMATLRRRK